MKTDSSTKPFADMQFTGARYLVVAGWVATALLAVFGVLLQYEAAAAAVTASAIANIVPSLLVWRGQRGTAVHVAIGLMMAVHPAALVYLFQVQPWQIDMHMYFFVALAGLTLLCDRWPLIAAGTLTAVHHLLLNYIAPEWVFLGSGQLTRVFVHALAVTIQVAVLILLVERVRILSLQQARERDIIEAHRKTAEDARREAESALAARADAERRAATAAAERQSAEREAEARRRKDLLELAENFEASISSVVISLSAEAERLNGTSRQLRDVSSKSHQDATSVDRLARAAASFAQQVAHGTSAIAGSVAEIAQNSDQQVRISADADRQSQAGVTAVTELAGRATNIEEFVGLIREISDQTNLLSLNATIEAARAGEAGRGFSVVAQEVKTLAARTVNATQRIDALLSEVGTDAARATGSIDTIRRMTADLLGSSSVISTAIEEQGRTTSDIEDSARLASEQVKEISVEIERLMQRVSTTDTLSGAVAAAAEALTKGAEDLSRSTQGFVGQLRAA
ncbi:methyl-accepting chemotaxis protein [Pacificimonas sp. ICDLI1SI03]